MVFGRSRLCLDLGEKMRQLHPSFFKRGWLHRSLRLVEGMYV